MHPRWYRHRGRSSHPPEPPAAECTGERSASEHSLALRTYAQTCKKHTSPRAGQRRRVLT